MLQFKVLNFGDLGSGKQGHGVSSEENLFIHLYGFLLVTKAGSRERGKHKTSKSFLFFLLLICIMLQVFFGWGY